MIDRAEISCRNCKINLELDRIDISAGLFDSIARTVWVCQTRVLIFVHVNVHKIWVAKTPYAITHFEMIAQFLNLVNGLISDWKIDCYFVQVMQSYSSDSKITNLVWFSMTKKISLKTWKSFKIQIGESSWMTSNWSNQQTFLCLPNLEVCTWHLKYATHF